MQDSENAEVITGFLNLVDLAGSERIAKSKSEGVRFQEAVVINSSLSALGRVVLALTCDPHNAKYIPYRDSKLTRILQSSLGGNSYTTLLACLHPSLENYDESYNSLTFADRCKSLQNRPVVNYIDPEKSGGDRRIRRLLAEISDLKMQLEISKNTFEKKVEFMNEGRDTRNQPDQVEGAMHFKTLQ